MGKEERASLQQFLFFRPGSKKVSSLGSLTLYQTTNIRLFLTESVCRRQFQIDGREFPRRIENIVGKGLKQLKNMCKTIKENLTFTESSSVTN